MNPDLARLHPYPFERLSALLDGVQPATLAPISLSIGEPRHPAPAFVLEELHRHAGGYSHYPQTRGSVQLREAIAAEVDLYPAWPERAQAMRDWLENQARPLAAATARSPSAAGMLRRR